MKTLVKENLNEGAIKTLYFKLIDLIIQSGDEDKVEELDNYMKDRLNNFEFKFYLENKEDLIDEAERILELDESLDETLVSGQSPQERFIDLRGPSGNAYVIIGMAEQLSKQLEKVNPKYKWENIYPEMVSGDYKNLVKTFEEYFGDYVTIYNADVLDESERTIKRGWNFASLSAGTRVKHKKSKKTLRLTSVGADHAFGKDSDGNQVKINSINDIEPVKIDESKKKNTKERDEILKRIQYAKDFTPNKVEYYKNMLKNYDDSFKKVNEGSDWIYLKSVDMYIDEYTGNFLDKEQPMTIFVEPGDDEYEELVSKLDSHDKTIHREVMTGTSDDEYENGQRYPGDNEVPDDDEEWTDPAGGTHRGDDDEPWRMYEAEDEEYLMPPLNEGCNCGGKKRPKPTIIRRPTNVVTLPPRKKLHELKDEIFMEPLNEVDYEAMARMNRETDRAPRFIGGMTKAMDPKKKVAEKPEYDYAERKEGFSRIAKQHKIMKDMGYDLDSEIEMPELAPTKRELGKLKKSNFSKIDRIEADRFNRLKGALGKEEKAMSKFHKKHLKGKSFESTNEEFSAYAMYSGEHPYQNFEMKKNVIDKYFDEDYESFIMFKSPKYSEISKYIDNLERWKTIYQSSSGQGYAKINPDGNIIKAGILSDGGIVGAIYIKKSKLEKLLRKNNLNL